MDDIHAISEQTSCTVTLAVDGRSFEVPAGDTLLCSMLRAGFGVPYECNAGGCGSCKITLLEGEVSEDIENTPGLRPSERRKKKRLACVCRPRGNCVIDVRLDRAYQPKILPRRIEATFVSKRSLTHDLWEFRFRSEGPAEFLPGQYAKVQLPEVAGPRSYSMCNVANEEGVWAFQVKRVPGGSATTVLFEHDLTGTIVTIDAPFSIAHLDESSPRAIVCIAGGSGLAPMVSILHGAGQKRHSEVAPILYYGARTPRDVINPDYFSSIPDFDPGQQYHPVVSEPGESSDWRGPSGFLHEHLAKVLPADCSQMDFYIAGPPPMVDAVRRHLVLDRRVPVERLRYDRFF